MLILSLRCLSAAQRGNTVWGNTERDFSGIRPCTVRWYPLDSDCWNLILASAEVRKPFLHRSTVEFILHLLQWCCMKLHCQTETSDLCIVLCGCKNCLNIIIKGPQIKSEVSSLCNAQNSIKITFDSLFLIKTLNLWPRTPLGMISEQHVHQLLHTTHQPRLIKWDLAWEETVTSGLLLEYPSV